MRNLPNIYSQRDPQWASQRLGTLDGATIGQYGCFVTCFAMKAGYYGHTITPNALDDIFTNKNIYTSGDLLNDDDLEKVFPDIAFQDHYYYLDVAADLNFLKQLMQDDTLTVTLLVDFDHDPSDGMQYHFVECVDCDGTSVKIADPWYGTVDDFTLHYGNNPAQTILKFVVYKGNPTGQLMQIKISDFENMHDKCDLYDPMAAAGYLNLDAITKKVGELTQDGIYKQNAINTLNGKIDQLTQVIQTDAQEDHDMGVALLNTQHEVNHIAQAAGLDPNASEDLIVETITNLRKPHDEMVKEVQPTLEAAVNAAKGTSALKTMTFWEKLRYLFS